MLKQCAEEIMALNSPESEGAAQGQRAVQSQAIMLISHLIGCCTLVDKVTIQ